MRKEEKFAQAAFEQTDSIDQNDDGDAADIAMTMFIQTKSAETPKVYTLNNIKSRHN